MKNLSVTVVIPNMNRTDTLRKALWSVSAQTLLPIETIVIDDKSSDEKLVEIRKIIETFAETANARMIELPVNGGANKARNVGIREAKGTHIAFLDSDDLWLPGKLEAQVKAISELPPDRQGHVLSTTSRYRVNGEGELLYTQMTQPAFTLNRLKASNFLGTLSSALVGTAVAREINGFDESLPSCQDWDFYIRLMGRCTFVGIETPLSVYVDHDDDRITLNNRKRLKGHLTIYRKHMREGFRSGEIMRTEFYRNVAEDLQSMGKPKTAARFLAQSIANRRLYNESARDILGCLIHSWFRLMPPGSITKKRYRRYNGKKIRDAILGKRALSKINKDFIRKTA